MGGVAFSGVGPFHDFSRWPKIFPEGEPLEPKTHSSATEAVVQPLDDSGGSQGVSTWRMGSQVS